MRLLHFSDLHLDSHFKWAGPELGRARRQALRQVLTNICDLARTESVDALFCGGDLYESERFTPDTVRFVADAFNQLDVPVLLAPGNHDWYGPRSLYAAAAWSSNVHVFTSSYLEAYELTPGFTVWGAAHRAPANTDGFLENFTLDRDGINIALFHGSEQGSMMWEETGKVPHAPFREQQVPDSGLDHALVGHFHAPRHATWHTYPGNPDPLTFGEEGNRGPVIVEVTEDGQVDRTTHDVAVSRLHDIDISLDGIDHSGQVITKVQAALAPLTGVVRATLNGEVGEDVDVRLEDLQHAGDHLDGFLPRVGEVTAAYDLDELAHEQTVRGQFVRDVRDDASLDDEQRHRVIVTGLRALAGRTDLEVQ